MKIYSLSIRILLFTGLVGIATQLFGQDEPEEVIESSSKQVQMMVIDDEGLSSPMIFSTTSTSNGDGITENFFSSGISMGAKFNISGSPSGPGPDPFSMLGDPSVQKDLELVGDQVEKLTALQKSFSEKMKEQIGDPTKDGLNPDRLKGLGEMIKKLRDEQQSQMKEMLLPHQIDRLKQISVQRHMQNAGTAGALASDKLAEELGITDEQKSRLKKRGQEIAKETEQKIEQLKEDAREKLLAELTAEQRQKLKQLTGEKFKSDPQDWSDKMKTIRRTRPGGDSK